MAKTAKHAAPQAVKITAISVAQVAKVLSAAGERRVTEEMVRADIEAGAPTNADGTVNLVHYTAWLVQEVVVGD